MNKQIGVMVLCGLLMVGGLEAGPRPIELSDDGVHGVSTTFHRLRGVLSELSAAIDDALGLNGRQGIVVHRGVTTQGHWTLAGQYREPVAELNGILRGLLRDLAFGASDVEGSGRDREVVALVQVTGTLAGSIVSGDGDLMTRRSALVRVQRELIPQALRHMSCVERRLVSSADGLHGDRSVGSIGTLD